MCSSGKRCSSLVDYNDGRTIHWNPRSQLTDLSRPDSHFATTQWTVVWQAAREDSQHGRPALTEIVSRYWQPLYSYARRQGFSSEDAEDATQEFLSSVVAGRLLEQADPAKGKFRSFLLTAWKRFLVDEYRKRTAVRRGGDAVTLSLDVGNGEQDWLELRADQFDPDHLFHISWAKALLAETRLRIRRSYQEKGKTALVDALLPRLTQVIDSAAYAQLATTLEMSPGAVKVAMHRLRQRFGATLRDVVAETIEDTDELDAELNEMLRVLSA